MTYLGHVSANMLMMLLWKLYVLSELNELQDKTGVANDPWLEILYSAHLVANIMLLSPVSMFCTIPQINE